MISAVAFSCQSILLALLPLLERLLEQSSPYTHNLLRDEARFMLLILSKYNEASAPLLAKDENCLDLFIRALRISTQKHPDIPSCQIYALEQVSPISTWLTTRINQLIVFLCRSRNPSSPLLRTRQCNRSCCR